MTSKVKQSIGLSPIERTNNLATAKNAEVIRGGAQAEGEGLWEDVRDETAAGSEDICRPCGDGVTTRPAEDAPIKVARDPGDPSEEEFQNHCVTHLPYRGWCPICVKAKGKEDGHKEAGESTKPTVVLDYK